MATFIPAADYSGDFIKPEFGVGPKFLGFSSDMTPLYEFLGSVQDPLIKKGAEEFKVAWSAFNAAISFPPSWQEPLINFQEVLDTVKGVVDALVLVLDALKVFADFNLNVLEAVIQGILLLIGRVLELLNPKVSVHALLIPPRLGSSVPPVLAEGSMTPLHKAVETTSSIASTTKDLLSQSLSNIPSLAGVTLTGAGTGASYLQGTLNKKIDDFRDPNRPALRTASHFAGVGLFFGSTNINGLLSQWYKVLTLLGQATRVSEDKSLPPTPKVLGPTVAYDTSKLDNMVVYPRVPLFRKLAASRRGDAVWIHTARLEYCSSTIVSAVESTKLTLDINSLLDTSDKVKALTSNPGVEILGGRLKLVSSWVLEGDSSKPEHSGWGLGDAQGNLALYAIDVYTLQMSNTYSVYLARCSPAVLCKYDPSYKVNSPLENIGKVNYYVDYNGSPNATAPKWISAQGGLSLLPTVFTSLSGILNLITAWLKGLIEEALNVFASVVAQLKKALQTMSKFLEAINALISLLEMILSINLSCSGISFAGEGGAVSLKNIFKQYFENSGAPSNFSTTGLNMTGDTSQATAAQLAGAVVSSSPSELNSKAGDILSSQREAARLRRQALGEELEIRQWYTGGAGKVSPTFSAADSTAGVVLLAYSEVAANVQAFLALLELIFNAESESTGNQPNETQDAVNNLQSILKVPTSPRTLIPENIPVNPSLFGESMELVETSEESPFKFCP